LVAVTLKPDELPAAIDAGLAVMATVGAGDVLIRLPFTHPVSSRGSKRPGAIKERIQRMELRMRAFVKMLTFLSLTVNFAMCRFEVLIHRLMLGIWFG
jgi:hypothetical protein